MTALARLSLIVGSLLLAAASPSNPASATGHRVESVGVSREAGELVVEIRTSTPAPPFQLTLPDGLSQIVVVLWPDTSTSLPAELTFEEERLPAAALVQGAGGLRLSLPVTGFHFARLDQTATGLRLHLQIDAPRPGMGADDQIGVGDKIEIAVFGHEDMSKTLEVRPDGRINFPLIGDVAVAGKSIEEVDALITGILARDFLVDPQVNIDLKESAKLWVTVMGEIRSPGRFALKRSMRLIDLLAAAGGVTKEAGSRIYITRRDTAAGSHSLTVDREQLFARGDDQENVLLERNDVVTIGPKDYYYIRGEITRPGPYYLESGMTVLKAISVAGGLTQFANRRQIELLRQGDKGMQAKVVVNMKAVEDGKTADVPLRPDDTIIVLKKVF